MTTPVRSCRSRSRLGPFSPLIVRSTPRRTSPNPLTCPVRLLATWGAIPTHPGNSLVPSRSSPQSAYGASGNSFGRTGLPPGSGSFSMGGLIGLWSLVSAPAVRIVGGTPEGLTISMCPVPG